MQRISVQLYLASGHLQPNEAIACWGESNGLRPAQQGYIDVGILMDEYGSIPAIARRYQAKTSPLFFIQKCFLVVARRQASPVWHDPNLQEMEAFLPGRIEFAVANARAGGHHLHIAWTD